MLKFDPSLWSHPTPVDHLNKHESTLTEDASSFSFSGQMDFEKKRFEIYQFYDNF